MAKRKPRTRKAAASSRTQSGRGRIGPLWWGAGALALGWIAFDANRPAVERHVPQLAALRLPWDAPAPPHREAARHAAAPARPVAVRPVPEPSAPRPVPKVALAPETRTAALRSPALPAPVVPAPSPAEVPARAPAAPQRLPAAAARPVAPTAAPALAVPPAPVRAAAGASGLVTGGPTPLRRSPRAGAPVWMVLEPGRPLRVTRREGGFARVESGIFTGWVEASVVPDAAARPTTPRGAASTMPTLAAAETRRAGPVPAAAVPAR